MIHRLDSKTGEWTDIAERFTCNFGIVEGALIAIGVGAETAAIASPILVGAGLGSLEAGITGGDPLTGALTGGLSGGIIGIGGPILGEAAGIGAFGGDVLAGGAAGLINSGITGTDPLTGLATGAGSGALSGLTSSFGAHGGGTSASAGAAPGAGAPDISGQIAEATGGVSSDFTGSIGTGATPGGSFTPGQALGSGAATAPFGAGDNLNLTLPNTTPGIDLAGGGFDQLSNIVGAASSPGAGGPGGAAGGLGGAGRAGLDLSIPDVADVNAGFTPVGAPAGLPGTSGGGDNIITQGLEGLGVGDKTAGFLGRNAGAIVAGGALASNLFSGNELPAGSQQLTDTAGRLLTQGNQLTSYVNSGKLPAGAQASLDRASAAAKATVRSRYASMGLAGSTMEAQDLASIDQNTATQGFQIADQLLQQGISETGLASGIYENLIRLNQEQDQATGTAIANFAAALSGTSGRRSANA